MLHQKLLFTLSERTSEEKKLQDFVLQSFFPEALLQIADYFIPEQSFDFDIGNLLI